MSPPSMLAEPSTPPGHRGTPELVVVFPDACPGRRLSALTALVAWLDGHVDPRPAVVHWQTGPLAAGLRDGRVIDAGAVNDQRLPRALAAAGAVRVSRGVKTVRLRRLLAPMAAVDRVLLGGSSTAALLDWLPPRPGRRVAAWLGDDDLGHLERVARVADHLFVTTDQVSTAVAALGVEPGRVHRVGEPLLAPPRSVPAPAPAGRHRVLLVGEGAAVADAAPAVIAATSGLEQAHLAWLHLDEQHRWDRWADVRFAGLEAQVTDLFLGEPGALLDDVAALVLAGPLPRPREPDTAIGGEDARLRGSATRLATVAALAGVPVVGLGATEAVAVEVVDGAGLRDHLRALLTDPLDWESASADALDRAQPHRVDLAGEALVGALGLARR